MNPEIGRIHAGLGLEDELKRIEEIAKGLGKQEEGIQEKLDRAEAKVKREKGLSTAPKQGADFPPNWPTFQIGERVGPIKGWWFELIDVNLELQTLVVTPVSPAIKPKKHGRAKKRRRK